MLKCERPVRVLVVDKGRWWGGAEACLLGMIAGFDRRRVSVEVCVDYPLPHHERYRAAGAGIVTRFAREHAWMRDPLKKRIRGLDLADWTLGAVRLGLLLRRSGIDVVHINLLRNRRQDLLAARLAGKRVVGHVRHLATQISMSRAVLDRCDAIVCVSNAVRSQMALTGTRTELLTIYDGVDPNRLQASLAASEARRQLDLPPDALVIACPAVLEPRKGQDVAIRALALLGQRDDLRLVIAGGEPAHQGGSEGRRLKRLAAALGIERKVRFCGHLDDLGELYAASDIVVALARDGEAYGRVPVEAAHAGRPVVATGLGATPELVVADETGLLVAPGDERAVAAALGTLLSAPELRRDMGRRARCRAGRRFGLQQGLDALEALYRRLMARD